MVTFDLQLYFAIKRLAKGPLRNPQPHPPFFSKKVEIFISAEAFRYIMFMRKIFIAKSFVWRNNRLNCRFIMSTRKLPP